MKSVMQNSYDPIIETIRKKYGFDVISFSKNKESTDGNVYDLKTSHNSYIVKEYDDYHKMNCMIQIHSYLDKMHIPRIIQTINKQSYFEYQNQYYVIYSFLDGIPLASYNNSYPEEIVISVAKEVRRLHDLTRDKSFSLQTVEFANQLKRKSLIHFDLTKGNIFIHQNKIGFIDFDDAMYGDSVCDVAILLSCLFVSKTRGIDHQNIHLFLDSYYEGEEELKKEELPYIKTYIINWVDTILSHHSLDSSLREKFIFKKGHVDELDID